MECLMKIKFEYVEDAFGSSRVINEIFLNDSNLGKFVETIANEEEFSVVFILNDLTKLSIILKALRNEDYNYLTILSQKLRKQK